MKYYVVRLVEPVVGHFREDFFPRKFRYKLEAESLAEEVRLRGGKAVISRSARLSAQRRKRR